MLLCPVCGAELRFDARAARCPQGHSFDLAREGYVNLLRTTKSGEHIGDDKQSARARRDFLNKGYYAPLRDALVALFAHKSGPLLDICCGEGYYTAALAANPALDVYGFDISKEMIRLAAKRGGARYFVANLAAIPVPDASFAWAVHLFAPFNGPEFARVLRPGGTLYTVIPGARHLWGLKERLYERPYPNDEKLPDGGPLFLQSTQKVCAAVTLRSAEDIEAVFRMTPYYYRTSSHDKAKLADLQTLDTELEFLIAAYGRPSEGKPYNAISRSLQDLAGIF